MKKFKSKCLYCVVRTNKFGFLSAKFVFDNESTAVRELRSLQQVNREYDLGFCYYLVPFEVPVYYFG